MVIERARALAATLALLVGTLALVGADQPREPYTIDAIIPLTGSSAYSGQIHATSLRIYESVANASGGIRGRPVHFEIHDDHSSPVIAVQLVTELLAKNPQLIMGSTYIAGCAAEEPLVRNGPVEFCFSPGLVTTQHNVFASSVANTYIIPATLKFIRERKYARLAVISATDASGSVADRITLTALARPENKNLAAVDYEHFNPTDISVSAQTARIKAGNPQAIIVYATGSAFGTVLRALNDAGVNIPVFTSAVNMNPIQLAQYSNFLPKELIFNTTLAFARDQVRDRDLRASIDEFYAGYRRAGLEPSPESSLSWDPAKIVVASLRALGLDATGSQLADFIGNLHGFAGASGIYDFRNSDHHGLTDAALAFVKWVPSDKSFAVVSKPGGSPL